MWEFGYAPARLNRQSEVLSVVISAGDDTRAVSQ